MRDDMFKVIVERPRIGHRDGTFARNRLSVDVELPTKIGVRRLKKITRTNTKWLNENLKPLQRYLGRQVGRPWDRIYSEICAGLDVNHTVKQHVRDHLEDFVAIRVRIARDGRWMAATDWNTQMEPWRQCFYVDPHDGLLKESARLWKKRSVALPRWMGPRDPSKPAPDIRRIDDCSELRRIDGIWYAVEFAVAPGPGARPEVFDLLTRETARPDSRYARRKRQLSAAELAGHGLKNDPGV